MEDWETTHSVNISFMSKMSRQSRWEIEDDKKDDFRDDLPVEIDEQEQVIAEITKDEGCRMMLKKLLSLD